MQDNANQQKTQWEQFKELLKNNVRMQDLKSKLERKEHLNQEELMLLNLLFQNKF